MTNAVKRDQVDYLLLEMAQRSASTVNVIPCIDILLLTYQWIWTVSEASCTVPSNCVGITYQNTRLGCDKSIVPEKETINLS